MAKVLAVGVATLDLVQLVEQYPALDSELRAEQQHLWRGGNATNTLVVLSQLGEHCSWLGTLADDVFSDLICADLASHHIDYSLCPHIENTTSPTSHILLSRKSASRNIVHYRNLRELNQQDSEGIDFSYWDWIHFEGRNIGVSLSLMRYIKQQHPNVRVSLEVEKPREGIEQLYYYADCILFSRCFVEAQNFKTAEPFLRQLYEDFNQSCDLVCSWGVQGAMALTAAGVYLEAAALKLEVIDTRAAGDVFNAAYIHACLEGHDVAASLEKACQLAGIKCSQMGIENIEKPA